MHLYTYVCEPLYQVARFLLNASLEAFTSVMFQVEVFWYVLPCSIMVVYQRFRGPCFVHLGEVLVKVKLSLCFNWAPLHEGILGEWSYSSTHALTLAPAALLPRKETLVPIG
jgi:hypothetical protein